MAQSIPAVDPSTATGKLKELFDGIATRSGRVANIQKTMGNSPAALQGYVAFNEALKEGQLSPQFREQIALAIGEANCCDYCISAHTAIGKMVGLDENDVAAARRSRADDDKTEVALAFVHKMVVARGQVSDDELQKLRAAGYTDGEIIEIIAHIALNTFTNYFNRIAKTTVDFPKVAPAAGV
jgi:uncharacterized peroxidase-related enzyme